MAVSKHLFFDLDHTIWDFEANADETLRELYELHELQKYSDHNADEFIAIYRDINNAMWVDYRQHKIDKETLRTERFVQCFKAMNYPQDKIPADLWLQYIQICPTKTKLIPGALDTLNYLADSYSLHLITNGFSETQRRKLKHSNLEHYFESLTISEEVGAKKPERKIFDQALNISGSGLKTGTYVGDSHDADVVGAINADWHMFWFNPEGSETPISSNKLKSIKNLQELKEHF